MKTPKAEIELEKQTPQKTEECWIFFQGERPRNNEIWEKHGLSFKQGYAYKVTENVFEYLKVMRGFTPMIGTIDKIQDFKKG